MALEDARGGDSGLSLMRFGEHRWISRERAALVEVEDLHGAVTRLLPTARSLEEVWQTLTREFTVDLDALAEVTRLYRDASPAEAGSREAQSRETHPRDAHPRDTRALVPLRRRAA